MTALNRLKPNRLRPVAAIPASACSQWSGRMNGVCGQDKYLIRRDDQLCVLLLVVYASSHLPPNIPFPLIRPTHPHNVFPANREYTACPLIS